MSSINVANELSKMYSEKSHPGINNKLEIAQMQNVQMQIRHSTLVRLAQRHEITREAISKIIDDAINYYLDNVK